MEVKDGSSWSLRMVPHGGWRWFLMEFKDGSSWRLDDGSSWRVEMVPHGGQGWFFVEFKDGSSWKLGMVPHGSWELLIMVLHRV